MVSQWMTLYIIKKMKFDGDGVQSPVPPVNARVIKGTRK